MKRSGLQLQYRKGYFAGKSAGAGMSATSLDAALLSPLDATGLGITAKLAPDNEQPGRLRIHFTLDAAPLELHKSGEDWTANLKTLIVETDDKGGALAKFDDSVTFRILSKGRADFERDGLRFSKAIPVDKAMRNLHLIVRDRESGRTGSITIPITK